MDGFRFWKSGYWASHLAGRKYHIRYATWRLKVPNLSHHQSQFLKQTIIFSPRFSALFAISLFFFLLPKNIYQIEGNRKKDYNCISNWYQKFSLNMLITPCARKIQVSSKSHRHIQLHASTSLHSYQPTHLSLPPPTHSSTHPLTHTNSSTHP